MDQPTANDGQLAPVSAPEAVRVAAIGDLHYGRTDQALLRPLFGRISGAADVLVLCGDLVDHGQPDEARVLARELAALVGVPVVAVLGNHDFEAGKADEIAAILRDAGVHVLDGDSYEVGGLGIAGVKGFCGGFGVHALGAWGEAAIKAFVHEAINEALKLETALSQLHATAQRIAVLHYAPIVQTIVGEALEIYPYLGSSRLEEPLNRYGVAAVFHGHAHAGSPAGRTSAGIPVYNVSVPVLQRAFADVPPVRIVEIGLPAAPAPMADGGRTADANGAAPSGAAQ
jgi:Icc-related predicted phosphoesterase